ncbi:hypothetical protein D9M71_450480 [compost metagenome]
MLGTAIDVGAQIEQEAAAMLGRNGRDHRRPIDTRQGLQHMTRQRHQRTGITGTDAGLSRAGAHQLESLTHGGIELATQHLRRTFVHRNHFAGGMHKQTRPIHRGMLCNQRFDNGGQANENQLQGGMFGQTGNAGWNNAVGTVVPTHCINRDDRSGQGLLVSALVDHLATTVNAFRAYVVAQVNFTGALLDGQRASHEAIVRTTHVAGGTRLFVLLNSHTD